MADRIHNLEGQLNKAIVEYTRRVDRGEHVERLQFLQEHSAIADQLSEHFDDLDFAQALAVDARSATAANTNTPFDTNSAPHVTIHQDGLSEAQREGRSPFGPYRIEDVLGRGGMGVVYLATERKLNRKVALKIPFLVADETGLARKRFHREAQLAANLKHPNICPIYHFGDVAGVDFICMPVVTGNSLATHVEAPHLLSPESVVELVRRIALAGAAAHKAGIVHRDLKPANIIIGDDMEPMILDFGLAAPLPGNNAEKLTQAGAAPGTLAYMAPEQFFPAMGNISPATDVFALGLIFYELLTGKTPFENGPFGGLVDEQTDAFVVPSKLRPGVTRQVDNLCRQMLIRDPEKRCEDMSGVADTLSKISAGQSSEKSQPKTFTQKHVLAVATLLTLTILLVLWASGVVFRVQAENGSLVVSVPDDRFIASVAEKTVKIANSQTGDEYTVWLGNPEKLPPGEYKFLVETDTGFRTKTKHFSVASGKEQSVDVWWEPDEKAPEPAARKEEIVKRPGLAIAPFDEAVAVQFQKDWAAHLGVSIERTVRLRNDADLALVLIPPGEFEMGSNPKSTQLPKELVKAFKNDLAPQTVRISEPFWMSRHEITVEQYQQFVNETGFQTSAELNGFGGWGNAEGEWKRDPQFDWRDGGYPQSLKHPVMNVAQSDATAFCRWLSQGETLYELPTEAQWEYACRAGNLGSWHWGDDGDRLSEHAWFGSNSGDTSGKTGQKPHSVGLLKSNPWKLHDMYGNVWEWCASLNNSDTSLRYPQGNSNHSEIKPHEAFRRGGGWYDSTYYVRSANRSRCDPRLTDFNQGFRITARVVSPNHHATVTNANQDQHTPPTLKTWPPAAPSAAIAPFTANVAHQHQQAWADYLQVPKTRTHDTKITATLKMTLIPVGEFLMGSTKEQHKEYLDDAVAAKDGFLMNRTYAELPQHKVRIQRPYYLGTSEVTQQQYHAVMGANPSHFSANGKGKTVMENMATDRHPVENVSWLDAVRFCNKLSDLEYREPYYSISEDIVTLNNGNGYRLPTEAEWEFACRAGTSGTYNIPDNLPLSDFAWHESNSAKATRIVGESPPNNFGIHDMHGNVWEWCQDYYDSSYYYTNLFRENSVDPHGPVSRSQRVVRGGSWNSLAARCRSALRTEQPPESTRYNIGFRVAITVVEDAEFSPAAAPDLEEIDLVDDTEAYRNFLDNKTDAPYYTQQHSELTQRLRTETGEQRTQTLQEISNLKWPADHFRRDRIPRDTLTTAGWGNIKEAPPSIVALLGDPRFNCWSVPHHVCLTDDGDVIVASHRDGTVSFHHTKSGRLLRTHKCHKAPTTSFAVSDDGQYYGAGYADGTVSLWNRHDGTRIGTYTDHADSVTGISFSPQDSTFASSSLDGTIRIYPLERQSKTHQTLNGEQAIYDLEFVNDGRSLVSAGVSENLCVWDVSTGQPSLDLAGHSGVTKKLAVSSTNHLLASLDTNGKTMLWNTKDWSIARSFQSEANAAPLLAMSHDGRFVVLREGPGTEDFALWEVTAGRRKRVWRNQERAADSICIDPAGQFVVAGNQSSRISVYDFATEADRFSSANRLLRPKSKLSQDGTRLLLVGTGIDLHAWNLNTRSLTHVKATRPGMISADMPADGKELATAGTTWKPAVFDIESGKLLSHPRRGHTNLVHAVTYSHDGTTIASGASDRMLWLWDRTTMSGRDIDCRRFNRIRSLAFSQDDQLIAIGDKAAAVQIRSTVDGALIESFNGQVGESRAVLFTPDSQQVIQGTGNGTIKIWDLSTKLLAFELKGHSNVVFSLTFSHDRRTMASSAEDGLVILWDTKTWQPTGRIKLYPFGAGRVYLAGFTPEDRHLVATCDNGLAYILRVNGIAENRAQ